MDLVGVSNCLCLQCLINGYLVVDGELFISAKYKYNLPNEYMVLTRHVLTSAGDVQTVYDFLKERFPDLDNAGVDLDRLVMLPDSTVLNLGLMFGELDTPFDKLFLQGLVFCNQTKSNHIRNLGAYDNPFKIWPSCFDTGTGILSCVAVYDTYHLAFYKMRDRFYIRSTDYETYLEMRKKYLDALDKMDSYYIAGRTYSATELWLLTYTYVFSQPVMFVFSWPEYGIPEIKLYTDAETHQLHMKLDFDFMDDLDLVLSKDLSGSYLSKLICYAVAKNILGDAGNNADYARFMSDKLSTIWNKSTCDVVEYHGEKCKIFRGVNYKAYLVRFALTDGLLFIVEGNRGTRYWMLSSPERALCFCLSSEFKQNQLSVTANIINRELATQENTDTNFSIEEKLADTITHCLNAMQVELDLEDYELIRKVVGICTYGSTDNYKQSIIDNANHFYMDKDVLS